MAGFFGFGSFSSPVGQLIEKATDNAASAGNLPLQLQICDVITEADNGPKEAVVAIRKRLTGSTKNFHIINLTLTVLETCVKNCGLRFHAKIAQKEFLVDLMKVIHPKNNPPTIVRERVLSLIQYWSDAFKGKPSLVAVEEMYDQMKAEGVEFPPIDLDVMTPIETPTTRGVQQQQQQHPGGQLQLHQPGSEGTTSGSSPSHLRPQQQSSTPQSSYGIPRGPLKPEQVAKMMTEFDLVRTNVDIMSEIMNENEPGQENQEDMQLLDELNRVVHDMQVRVAGLIERCQDEIILESTLVINDDLNTLFVRYDRWLRNSMAAKSGGGEGMEGPPPTYSSENVVNNLTPMPSDSGTGISYPKLDDSSSSPPSYQASGQTAGGAGGGVGQLIDLGTDLTTIPSTQEQNATGEDIVTQLAQLGITPSGGGVTDSSEHKSDEFDMFAESRTAYGTQYGAKKNGSTYDDNMIQQNASLSAAVSGRGQDPLPQVQGSDQPPQVQGSDQPYSNLTQWLAKTDLEPPSQQQPAVAGTSGGGAPPPESATSAEFDQFLAQRASKGETLPPGRPRPQMQKAEDQSDELFSL